MRVPLDWLQDHITLNAGVGVPELARMFVQLGHEVESIEDPAKNLARVVIGKILERAPHPKSDTLGVCVVEVGETTPRTIVCGAANARAGLTVAVALDGAVLPNGITIGQRVIRGVESNGMICALDELGLQTERADGIWELDLQNPVIGQPLVEALQLSAVLELKITPNRGDCLSMRGLARDLAGAGLGALVPLPVVEKPAQKARITPVLETTSCSYFCGVSVRVNANSQSPVWLKKRLESIGLRPKNVPVDITNYIMFDLGQPLHAYDGAAVQGTTMRVVDAKGGEKFHSLKGDDLTLQAGDVIIYDDSGVIDLAGVTGSMGTAVKDGTTEIYLEGAYFDKNAIARAGQRYSIPSDARYRFERGIDSEMTRHATLRAAQLMAEFAGGSVQGVSEAGNDKAPARVLAFDPLSVQTFGGVERAPALVKADLIGFGFGVDDSKTPWQVSVPSFRTIMDGVEDVVEEIIRKIGTDAVAPVLPPTPEYARPADPAVLVADRISRRQLASSGFLETLTYSFIAKPQAEHFAGSAALMLLANPIDAETMAVMRPSLLPGLLAAVASNTARSTPVEAVAEVGNVYGVGLEKLHAAGVRLAPAIAHWRAGEKVPDAFDVKADVLALLRALGVRGEHVEMGAPAWFHPGQSGVVKVNGQAVGHFGVVHPKTLKLFGLEKQLVAFEVDVSAVVLQKISPRGAFALSDYQPTTRDMALVVDVQHSAAAVESVLRAAAGTLLKDITLFDVYEGKHVGEGKKSLAFRLNLQANDKTLTEAEIQAVVDAATAAAKAQLGAQLRTSSNTI